MALTIDGPPWGSYVDDDEAYVRGQAMSLGSGLLGGWSGVGSGGFFDSHKAIEEEEDERRELHHLQQAAPHL